MPEEERKPQADIEAAINQALEDWKAERLEADKQALEDDPVEPIEERRRKLEEQL